MITQHSFAGWSFGEEHNSPVPNDSDSLHAWFADRHDGWQEQLVREAAVLPCCDSNIACHPATVYRKVLQAMRSDVMVARICWQQLEKDLENASQSLMSCIRQREACFFPWLCVNGLWGNVDALYPLGTKGWKMVRHIPSVKLRTAIVDQTAVIYQGLVALGLENIEIEFFDIEGRRKPGTRLVKSRLEALGGQLPLRSASPAMPDASSRADYDDCDVRCLLRGKGRWQLLQAKGIEDIRNIPSGEALSLRQRNQRRALIDGTPYGDREALKSWLADLSPDMCFLDFECIQSPQTLFAGTSPWQYVPVMYSLTGKNGDTVWFCLPPDSQDLAGFAVDLAENLKDCGDIAVYGDAMERRSLALLANLVAGSDHEQVLRTAIDKIVDLHTPFESGWLYFPEQKGKTSLKTIAAILGQAYDDHSVADGRQASLRYFWLRHGYPDATIATAEKKRGILSAIEKYSRADTRNLFLLWQAIKRLV